MIFDAEKWERIKNRREDAYQAYQAANEDWQFEKKDFAKIAEIFKGNFPLVNKLFIAVDEAITQLRRMDPLNIPMIELKVEETLALPESGSDCRRHLTVLLEKLITMKRAEARKEQAAEVQRNNTECFNVLETFARKHIKLPTSSGPYPAADIPLAVDFYTESYND